MGASAVNLFHQFNRKYVPNLFEDYPYGVNRIKRDAYILTIGSHTADIEELRSHHPDVPLRPMVQSFIGGVELDELNWLYHMNEGYYPAARKLVNNMLAEEWDSSWRITLKNYPNGFGRVHYWAPPEAEGRWQLHVQHSTILPNDNGILDPQAILAATAKLIPTLSSGELNWLWALGFQWGPWWCEDFHDDLMYIWGTHYQNGVEKTDVSIPFATQIACHKIYQAGPNMYLKVDPLEQLERMMGDLPQRRMPRICSPRPTNWFDAPGQTSGHSPYNPDEEHYGTIPLPE